MWQVQDVFAIIRCRHQSQICKLTTFLYCVETVSPTEADHLEIAWPRVSTGNAKKCDQFEKNAGTRATYRAKIQKTFTSLSIGSPLLFFVFGRLSECVVVVVLLFYLSVVVLNYTGFTYRSNHAGK